LLCNLFLTFLGKEKMMNLFLLFAIVFFNGVVVGYMVRDLFWLNEDNDKNVDPANDSNDGATGGRDLEAEEERSNEHAYQRGLAQRAQVKRLVLENAQLRQRIDERFSENG
jgi:hypothetical protein